MDSCLLIAPSRLHFGLLEIKEGEPHRYGGIGLMIDSFPLRMRITDSSKFEVRSSIEIRQRIDLAVRLWKDARRETSIPSITITVEDAPRSHHGFGSGTQLACAVATALEWAMLRRMESGPERHANSGFELGSELELHGNLQRCSSIWKWPDRSVERIKEATNRGLRSHIGLAGFLWGGFLIDHGQTEDVHRSDLESLASDSLFGRRLERIAFPDEWRIVLVMPDTDETISGQRESEYFRRCEIARNPRSIEMLNLIEGEIRSGLGKRSIEDFGEALYEYGRLAGEIFRSVQYSAYRTLEIEDRVQRLRALGVRGVGQSSWGPCVYGIVANAEHGKEVASRLESKGSKELVLIASANQSGALIDRSRQLPDSRLC